jgi:hypothetical protein
MVQRRWIIPGMAVFAALSLTCCALTTPPMAKPSTKRTVQRKAMVDPHDVVHAHSHLEALLSTLYAEILKPAQEHTQPLWGPPDPILSAGKSIIPSPNAFSDAGGLTAVAPPPTLDITDKVSDALMKTKGAFINVIDPTAVISFDKVLPGFKETGHVLPLHIIPEDTPESLILEMGSVAKMMRVVNNLPMAAFLYTCVEFFLVKPGYDVYKEELDESHPEVEFLMLSGLRFGILSVIGLVTLGLFDK